jgi:hypothetical protein
MVAAVGCFAAGPATASCEASYCGEVRWILKRFDGEVSLVSDELRVEAEPPADGLVDLGGRVIVGLQTADRGLDERAKVGDVSWGGDAVVEGGRHQRIQYDAILWN